MQQARVGPAPLLHPWAAAAAGTAAAASGSRCRCPPLPLRTASPLLLPAGGSARQRVNHAQEHEACSGKPATGRRAAGSWRGSRAHGRQQQQQQWRFRWKQPGRFPGWPYTRIPAAACSQRSGRQAELNISSSGSSSSGGSTAGGELVRCQLLVTLHRRQLRGSTAGSQPARRARRATLAAGGPAPVGRWGGAAGAALWQPRQAATVASSSGGGSACDACLPLCAAAVAVGGGAQAAGGTGRVGAGPGLPCERGVL